MNNVIYAHTHEKHTQTIGSFIITILKLLSSDMVKHIMPRSKQEEQIAKLEQLQDKWDLFPCCRIGKISCLHLYMNVIYL